MFRACFVFMSPGRWVQAGLSFFRFLTFWEVGNPKNQSKDGQGFIIRAFCKVVVVQVVVMLILVPARGQNDPEQNLETSFFQHFSQNFDPEISTKTGSDTWLETIDLRFEIPG